MLMSPVSSPTRSRPEQRAEVAELLVRERLERRGVESAAPGGQRRVERILADHRLARAGRRADHHAPPGLQAAIALELERVERERVLGQQAGARRGIRRLRGAARLRLAQRGQHACRLWPRPSAALFCSLPLARGASSGLSAHRPWLYVYHERGGVLLAQRGRFDPMRDPSPGAGCPRNAGRSAASGAGPDRSPIAVQALLEAHGVSISYQAWEAAWQMAFFIDYPRRGADDWREFLGYAFERLGEPLPEPAREAVIALFDAQPPAPPSRMACGRCRRREARGLRTAAFTTIPRFRMASLLAELGDLLDLYFDGFEAGDAKGSRRYYERLAARWAWRRRRCSARATSRSGTWRCPAASGMQALLLDRSVS